MVNNASQMQINEHMYSKLNKCKLTGQFKNHKKGKHVGEDAKKSISAGWTKILKVRKKIGNAEIEIRLVITLVSAKR